MWFFKNPQFQYNLFKKDTDNKHFYKTIKVSIHLVNLNYRLSENIMSKLIQRALVLDVLGKKPVSTSSMIGLTYVQHNEKKSQHSSEKWLMVSVLSYLRDQQRHKPWTSSSVHSHIYTLKKRWCGDTWSHEWGR